MSDVAKRDDNDSDVVVGQHEIDQNASFLEWENLSVSDALSKLKTSSAGLSNSEAGARRALYGANEVAFAQPSRLRSLLSFLWNPLSWMLELAVLVALLFGQWIDAGVIIVMLGLNAIITFYGDNTSSNAAALLKDQLALKCHVKRDGEWRELLSADLTIGDVVSVQDGDVVPADCKILTKGVLRCDQTALTGQTHLPNKSEGDVCFSGSSIKTGTGEAVVFAIGNDTFFGQALDLLKKRHKGRLQGVLASIGNFIISFIFVMIMFELAVQVGHRGQPWRSAVANTLVLVIGAVPIAMPTVLSFIMALGAIALSKKDIIVRRLNAIEELASMDILCANKSGTICTGELEIVESETITVNDHTAEEVLFYAAIAAQPDSHENLDKVVLNTCPQRDDLWTELERLHFVPFDPLQKKTIASIRVRSNGNTFRAAKGAPWVILALDQYAYLVKAEVEGKINDLAERGFSVVGVAVSRDPADMPIDQVHWEMVGLLALKDPPREESANSLQEAESIGVQVKMITGEQLSSAVETCKTLGVPSALETGQALDESPDDKFVENADGFAELYPRHKFAIVERLQKLDHIVGISGSSVNDCAGMEKADIGFAVAGSMEAIRATSDIVLLIPGLAIIVEAILLSRKIFHRMHTFATYSLTNAIQIIMTFGVLTLLYDWYFPAFCILILVVLNDGTMMAMAKDNTDACKEPERWNLRSLFIQALAFGIWLALGALFLFALARHTTLMSSALRLESLASFGGSFKVGRDSDPLCNWELRFNFNTQRLQSCQGLDFAGINPKLRDDLIWKAYLQSSLRNQNGQCHEALAEAVCSIQQTRLGKLRSLIYLVVSVSGHAVVFAVRTKGWMWQSRPSNALIGAFFISQFISTLLGIFGFGRLFSARTYFAGIDIGTALFAWLWAIFLILPLDLIKFAVAKAAQKNEELYPDVEKQKDDGNVEESKRSARASYAKATSSASRRRSTEQPKPPRRSAAPRKSVDIANDLHKTKEGA